MNYYQLKKKFNELDIEKIKKFVNFLIKKNKVMNLISSKSEEDIIERHIYDSLFITKEYDFDKKIIMDVGTGAGFPGIPIAILFKKSKIILVDSTTKKTKFLEELVNFLSLKNVKIINDRVENIKNIKCDIVISRALANIGKIIDITIHLLKKNNILIMIKGEKVFEELKKNKEKINKNNLLLMKIQKGFSESGKKRVNLIFKKQ